MWLEEQHEGEVCGNWSSSEDEVCGKKSSVEGALCGTRSISINQGCEIID